LKERRNAHLILTGFMGTGKTTVGRILARRLGRPFVDMDALIEAREGRTIAAIFAEEGEGYFRRLEAALCRELAAQEGLVIATGGGALVDPRNLAVMQASGLIVCLDGEPAALWERLAGVVDRPLLAGPDGRARLEALLATRREAYARIPHHVETTGRTPEEVAEAVLGLWNRVRAASPSRVPAASSLRPSADLGGSAPPSQAVETLVVRAPGGEYPIQIGPGLLAGVGQWLVEQGFAGRSAIVTNERVGPLYADRLAEGFHPPMDPPTRCVLPDGERYKTLEQVIGLYRAFVAAGLDRRSPVIALGGGVVGDTAGFAAATYLRGVPFVQCPTTLLAMVDASVGGKVGVDLPEGKNLVGAFKMPLLVVADTETLRTLPPAELRAGLAEVVKHGLLADPGLLEMLEALSGVEALREPEEAARLVARAVAVKIAVVEEDPYEGGRRAILNLGHTFAHAFEQLSGYRLRHGEAVAMGLVCAARLSIRLGLAEATLVSRTQALLRRLGLPTEPPPYDPEAVWEAMGRDKKRRGRKRRFVLLRGVGEPVLVTDPPRAEVLEAMQAR